jgi:hypothetical protein
MSEMTKLPVNRASLRATLLATACGAALFAAAYRSVPAMASDDNQPMVWVELGGSFAQLDNGQETYLPPFTRTAPRLPFITVPPPDIEKGMPTSWDGNAKLTFEPSGMDWILSAGIVYGRSTRKGDLRQQTAQRSHKYSGRYAGYQSIAARNDDSHLILDFQAGKDVGLGMFGNNGHSKVNVGIRYAQLDSNRSVNIHYQPTNNQHNYNRFYGSLYAKHKFTGVGPSLSWDASAGLLGDAGGGISLDWGLNGAVLFGRQKLTGHHLTSGYAIFYSGAAKHLIYQHSFPLDRSKQVIVPNLGGFAGVSWRYPNAKISMGYRADMFFGAIDGGIDTAHRENVGFYGPFATISIGFGE